MIWFWSCRNPFCPGFIQTTTGKKKGSELVLSLVVFVDRFPFQAGGIDRRLSEGLPSPTCHPVQNSAPIYCLRLWSSWAKCDVGCLDRLCEDHRRGGWVKGFWIMSHLGTDLWVFVKPGTNTGSLTFSRRVVDWFKVTLGIWAHTTHW